MLFRHLLTQDYSVGKRGQKISKRSLSSVDPRLKSILLIDMSYIAYVLESKHKYKQSNVYNTVDDSFLQLLERNPKFLTLPQKRIIYNIREVVLSLLSDMISLVKPEHVLLVYGSTENLLVDKEMESKVRSILQLFSLDTIVIQNTFSDFLFSYCQTLDNLSDYHIIAATNSITAWACNSHTCKMGYIAISKNSRPIFYNNKTGIDIVCKFINTSKIVNKLNLDELKYVNLQYIYLLILYIKFMNHVETDSTFYFDAKYFKNIKHIKYSEFLRSNGLGLELIGEAHKTLSYIFLTKPDIMDQFLFYNTTTFMLNLQRLLKITEFDKTLMSHFSNYYIMTDMLRKIQLPETPLSSIYSVTLTEPRLYPQQYHKLLDILHTRKKLPVVKEKHSVEDTETSDMSIGVSDAISDILRRLLW